MSTSLKNESKEGGTPTQKRFLLRNKVLVLFFFLLKNKFLFHSILEPTGTKREYPEETERTRESYSTLNSFSDLKLGEGGEVRH